MFSSCNRCNASGMVIVESKKNKSLYVFGCSCEFYKSRRISKSIPQWSDKFKNDFILDVNGHFQPTIKKQEVIQPKIKRDFKALSANDHDFDDDVPF